ncbi:MAG: hypothetical protein JWM16_4412, partial [Verrucomicrobiales bacterium]|nr:hypothetical protein [Verrucomicrobiales bacterium]
MVFQKMLFFVWIKWCNEKNAQLLGAFTLELASIPNRSPEFTLNVAEFTFRYTRGPRIHVFCFDE